MDCRACIYSLWILFKKWSSSSVSDDSMTLCAICCWVAQSVINVFCPGGTAGQCMAIHALMVSVVVLPLLFIVVKPASITVVHGSHSFTNITVCVQHSTQLDMITYVVRLALFVWLHFSAAILWSKVLWSLLWLDTYCIRFSSPTKISRPKTPLLMYNLRFAMKISCFC